MNSSQLTLGEKLKLWALIALGWLFALLFIAVAVGSAMDGGWRGAGGSLLMAAALCPALRIPTPLRPWSIGAASVAFFVAVSMDVSSDEARTRAERAAASVEQEAARVEALRAEFTTRRDELVGTLESAIAAGAPLPALQATGSFREVADEDFLEVFGRADALHQRNLRRERETALVAQARTVPASDLERNRSIYAELVSLDSSNARYRERLEHYSGLIRSRQQAEAARRSRFGDPPSRSSWDGTYREVTSYLRDVANDPGSIDVDVCTEVYYIDDGWLVGCDYRGANAFGALILTSNWFVIRHGQVVRMLPSSAYDP